MRSEARRGGGGSGAARFRGHRRAPRTTAVTEGIWGHGRSRGGGKWEPARGKDSEPPIGTGEPRRRARNQEMRGIRFTQVHLPRGTG
jgi:hypothetical protein